MPQWQNDYLRGTGMEMYTEYLSESFVGLTFPEAAEYVLITFYKNVSTAVYSLFQVFLCSNHKAFIGNNCFKCLFSVRRHLVKMDGQRLHYITRPSLAAGMLYVMAPWWRVSGAEVCRGLQPVLARFCWLGYLPKDNAVHKDRQDTLCFNCG